MYIKVKSIFKIVVPINIDEMSLIYEAPIKTLLNVTNIFKYFKNTQKSNFVP